MASKVIRNDLKPGYAYEWVGAMRPDEAFPRTQDWDTVMIGQATIDRIQAIGTGYQWRAQRMIDGAPCDIFYCGLVSGGHDGYPYHRFLAQLSIHTGS